MIGALPTSGTSFTSVRCEETITPPMTTVPPSGMVVLVSADSYEANQCNDTWSKILDQDPITPGGDLGVTTSCSAASTLDGDGVVMLVWIGIRCHFTVAWLVLSPVAGWRRLPTPLDPHCNQVIQAKWRACQK
jgi:hypothetical protein